MNHVGCNITEKQLQIVEVVKGSQGYLLENVDEQRFSNELDFSSSDSTFVSEIQNAIESIWVRHPLQSTRISIALPVDKFRIFNFPYTENLTETKLKEQIDWEFSILFPTLSIEDYIVRPKIISKSFYSHQEVLVIAADKIIIQPIHDMFTESNIKLQFVDCSHFASDLLVGKQNSVSIYVSENVFSASIYSEGKLIGFRKFNPSDTDTLVDYISNITSHQESGLNKFYISGNNKIDETKSVLEDLLKCNFDVIKPFDRIKPSSSFIQNDNYSNHPNLFSAAAGIGFRLS